MIQKAFVTIARVYACKIPEKAFVNLWFELWFKRIKIHSRVIQDLP